MVALALKRGGARKKYKVVVGAQKKTQICERRKTT